MILFADSGSTKTEWILIKDGESILKTETIGFNPYFVDEGTINANIENSALSKYFKKVKQINFYGAGCSNEEKAKWLEEVFQKSFPKAAINIYTDIDGAVQASSEGKACIVCILGTGSTFRIYDGENIIRKYSSLSYVLGDEGSGTFIAKALLRGVFYENLDASLIDKFYEMYPIDSEILLQKVYNEPQANRYLASFVPFCKANIDHPEIEAIVLNAFEQFYLEHLNKYPEYKSYPIHFIGSIAFYFEAQLKKIAEKYDFKIGHIIQKPLEQLIENAK